MLLDSWWNVCDWRRNLQANLSEEARAEILKSAIVAATAALVPIVANALVDAGKKIVRRYWPEPDAEDKKA